MSERGVDHADGVREMIWLQVSVVRPIGGSTMMRLCSEFHLSVLTTVAVLACAVAVTARVPHGSSEKRIIVTVLDAQNRPVAGLPPDAFVIREDNIDREIVKVERADDPVATVLFADTTSAFGKYVGDLRTVTQAFIKEFFDKNPGSSLGLWEFGEADIPIVDLTTDAAKLNHGATRLFPKGSEQNVVGSALLEGIVSASKRLATRPERRRVIVSFNTDVSVEVSRMPGQRVQDAVQNAGVTLFALSINNNTTNGPLRDNVLNELCPYSGGKRFTIVDIASLESALKNIADVLGSQYAVTYTRPSGSAKQVLVGIRRNGLKASTARWAPK